MADHSYPNHQDQIISFKKTEESPPHTHPKISLCPKLLDVAQAIGLCHVENLNWNKLSPKGNGSHDFEGEPSISGALFFWGVKLQAWDRGV